MAFHNRLDQLVVHVVTGRNGAVVTQERNKTVRIRHAIETLLGGVTTWRPRPSIVEGNHMSIQAVESRVRSTLEQPVAPQTSTHLQPLATPR